MRSNLEFFHVKLNCRALVSIWAMVFLMFNANAQTPVALFRASSHSVEQLRADAKDQPLDTTPTVTLSEGGITFNIWYLDVINDSENGFDDPVLGESARERLHGALMHLDRVLESSGTLDILVQGSETDGTGNLADAGTAYTFATEFQNGLAFTRIQSGSKPFQDIEEIFVEVDFGYDWNFSEADAEPEQFDLQSVLLHELTHSLGLLSLSSRSGASAIHDNVYTVWDSLLATRQGIKLFAGSPPVFVGEPSDLVSGDVVFTGENATGLYHQGDAYLGIYSPEPFEHGKSLSHWDAENTIGGAVLEHIIAPGVTRRELTDFEIGALKDIGWANVSPDVSFPTVLSILPLTTGPTNDTSVDFQVRFSRVVTNFDLDDIILEHNGTASTNNSMSSGDGFYTVSVTGISGDGLIALSISTVSDVQDREGRPLSTTRRSELVIDNTPPLITQNEPAIMTVEAPGVWEEPGATALDNTDGIVEVVIGGDVVDTSAAVGTNYEVTYSATDAAGNISSSMRNVTIVDTIPPVIWWSAPDVIDCNSGSNYEYEGFARDEVDGKLPAIYTGEVDPTVSGEYILVYTASDHAGNIATQTRTVTVNLPESVVYVASESDGGSDDTGTGTESNPWATVRFALYSVSRCATAENPITIQLAPGTYQETIQLSPFVTITGIQDESGIDTIIAPTVAQILINRFDDQPTAVIAAEKSGLANLKLKLPTASGAGWRVLTVGNVSFNATNVEFDGSNVQGSVGILLSGIDSSDSQITNCFIHNLEFGIRALETSASVTQTTFESIEEDALFIVEPASSKGIETALVPNLGDVSLDDLEGVGGNIFVGGNSIGGNFINNRNLSATVQAEGNDFGTNNRGEILGKLGGNTDFEPRYTTGETDLVFDLIIDVSESANATPVTDAVVRLEPNVGLPTEIESGRYVFQSVPFQSYVISVSTANYQTAQVSLTDPDNSEPLDVILETDQGGVEFSAISVSLAQHFDALDLDSNGALSISEARAEVPNLSQSQFDTLDTNGDGQLSDIEIAAQVGEGEGEGEGETPAGCPGSKSDLIQGVKNAFGDMFLLGLGLMVLFSYGRISRRL